MNWEKYLPLGESAYNNSYHASLGMSRFEVLYERKCLSSICWMELSKRKLVGLDLVRETEEKDRQKAYADRRRKDISYEVADKVFLKEILECIGPVAHHLTLPPELSKIHDVFHVSMLPRYHYDPDHVVQLETLEVEPNLSYEEEPICIFDSKIMMLRNKEIPLVNVLWGNHKVEKATWEREST
ncbi:pol protein [Gossypium australe]|uniref:Pol protein n=1 Tax=Gossypium australe TaxID=47621 RepID=A0A5B6X257_9ROSI|nr:pol protein [Gossypium australe]